MKLVKSLLLGSAAGLVAAAGAQAADLPTRKAAPVEYVRICAVHGPGFFYIPGTDTCIRISGRARYEYVYSKVFNKSTDPSAFTALGRIAFDARTQTDWGLLRAYMRFDINRRTGNNYFGSGSAARGGFAFGFGGGAGGVAGGFPAYSGADTAGNRLQTGLGVSAAFVQWGGLTAGRIQSFFDFYADNDTWFGVTDSDILTQALAYTYTFGSGFSATLSIEDPAERHKNPLSGGTVGNIGGINPTTAIPGFGAPFAPGAFVPYPFAFSPYAAAGVAGGVPFGLAGGVGGINYTQRETVPDVVGVLRVDQGWGSAQLSGAYHRIQSSGSVVFGQTPTNTVIPGVVLNPLVGVNGNGAGSSTVPGGFGQVTGNAYAIQGGVKINLPMLAAGDTLYLQAAYSKGNLSYANSGYPSTFQGGANNVGGTVFSTYDGVVGPTGRLILTPAYSGLISFLHYWTPTIRQGLFAGAEHVTYSGAIRTAAGFAAGAACPTCFGTRLFAGTPYNPYSPFYTGGTQYNVGTNLIWSPVKDLDIGVEVFYIRNEMSHRQFDQNSDRGKLIKADDQWNGRLRIQRDF